MKKTIPHFLQMSLFLLLALVGLGLVSTRPVSAQTNSAAVVTVDAAYIRSGPGEGYPALLTAYKGYALTLLARNAEATWVKVRTSGNSTEGWVSVKNISTTANISALGVINIQTLEYTAVINVYSAYLRTGDTVDYPVVTTAGLHERVALLGRNGTATWAKVRVISTGKEGWVNASLLLPSDMSFLPQINVAPLPISGGNPAPSTGPTATVTAGYLNIRRGDGTSYGIITSMSYGQTVTVLGRNSSSTWAYIRTSTGQEGWVNGFYLLFPAGLNTLPVVSGGSTTPGTTPAPTPVPGTGTTVATATVNTDALYVRSGPGESYQAFGLLYRGQSIYVIGRSTDGMWLKVKDAAGQQGWVYASLVISSVSVANLPVVQ